MFDVVTIGNALIDAFLGIREASKHIRLLPGTKELCIQSGEKIPLDSATFQIGGNACNVAVGLARLGLHTGLIAEIGNEAFSNKIITSLQQEGVDTSHVLISEGPASFAVGINFQNERTLFVHHMNRPHVFTYTDIQPKWIYLTSLGEEWHHVYRDVATLVQEKGIHLAFNPGTRQIDAGRETYTSALEITHILFCNKEEAIRILGGSENESEESLLSQLQRLGPKIVVMTDGDKGSFVKDTEGNVYSLGITGATIVEKTGAGDAYASGFLAAYINGKDIQTAMQWGTQNAGSVIGQVGAQPGLLTKDKIIPISAE